MQIDATALFAEIVAARKVVDNEMAQRTHGSSNGQYRFGAYDALLHTYIKLTGRDSAKVYDDVMAAAAKHETRPQADRLGNTVAREGCDRCRCGCKYWENDKCTDCGKHVTETPQED